MPDQLSRRAALGATALLAAAPAAAQTPAPAPARAPVWSAEYTAHKGAVSLYVHRKRAGAPRPGEPPRPVLFLVHGSSMASGATYDLTVPGRGEYSSMNAYAALGYDVWTMDHEGYGRSDQTASSSDIGSGADDLAAAAEVVVRETGQHRAHYLGESSGALRAAVYAMRAPDRVDRLVLQAFTWTGAGSPTLARRAEQAEYYRTHARRPRDAAMLRSIFTRDMPGTSDPAVAEALIAAELPFGDSVPAGSYLDMTANLPVVDPARVAAPVLMIRGEHDGIASIEDLLAFYARLPNADRQFVILPHSAHAISLGLTRAQLWHAVHAFLTLPAATAA